MKILLTKITIFGFLIVWLLPLVFGEYLSFNLEQHKEQQHQLLLNSPSILNLSEKQYAELVWNNEGEFYYNGAFYDALGIVKKGNNYQLKCIADKQEETLQEAQIKHTKESTSPFSKKWIPNFASSLPSVINNELIYPLEFQLLVWMEFVPPINNSSFAIFIPPPAV